VIAVDAEKKENSLVMNKDMSTPYNCAMRMLESIASIAVI
jgi:hypothetical protein